MRNAETILGIIRDRGRRGLPLEDVYRQLFNPGLYLKAYGKIYRNAGAMTRGVTAETVDGMSLEKIRRIIELLKSERYRWAPVRRAYIEKKGSTKMRPLGLPTWSDKLLQEVVRSILEAYYEPQFSPTSHGFRPGRGCHTALTEIEHAWTGTVWFIEGDIKGCFDNIDHGVLLSVLRERIRDGRFLRLVENLLKAGYLEGWTYGATHSGTPQGGIVSPTLANLYLDRLDKFVETELLPAYNRGTRRKTNKAYRELQDRARRLKRIGRAEEAVALRKQMQRLPSVVPDDADYRRLRYARYADDFLLGFVGPRSEAEEIRRRVGAFLRDGLKLELSEAKTLITHARSEPARFLGYHVGVLQDDRRRVHRGRANGKVQLRVPKDVVRAKCHAHTRRGKPVHRTELTHDTEFSIVARFQQEYRGVAEYYKLAVNRGNLDRLKWVMEAALTKTLACKLGVSVRKVYARFGTTLQTASGPRKGLEVRVERPGKPPLVAQWGGITLARQGHAILDDRQPVVRNGRTELLQRLLAETCELCGSRDRVEVHHVRHLKDLLRRRRGRKPPPGWAVVMAARRRKTLVVCHECHRVIHAGGCPERDRRRVTGEPDDAKVSSPVRRGADGKGPS
jgi:group II intron reverse transcriptase/maturase